MSEKITFRELVERIAEETKQSNTTANSFISELVDLIELGLKDGQPVSISGFGKIELRWMNERKGTHPRTGEEILIPGQYKVVFKPFKALREKVNAPFALIEPQFTPTEKKKEIPEVNELPGTPTALPEKPVEKFIPAETIDDFLFEREIPEHLKRKTSGKPPLAESPNKKKVPSENETLPVKGALLADLEKRPAPSETAALRQIHKRSNFNWSMAAVGILVMLAFLLFFYFSQQRIEPDSVLPQLDEIEVPVFSLPELPEPTIQISDPEPVTVQSETVSSDESFTHTEVITLPGESLWTLAEREMGNPLLWPAIYYQNRDLLDNPNALLLNVTIQIPRFSDSENLNSVERQLVSKGYLELYHWNLRTAPDQARYFLWAAAIFSEETISQSSEQIRGEDLAFALNR